MAIVRMAIKPRPSTIKEKWSSQRVSSWASI
jgi:hypothetical protein